MSDDKQAQRFRTAVENNEYAEYELGDGFVLETDERAGGMFHPSIVPSQNHVPDLNRHGHYDCEAIDEIKDELNEIILFDEVVWDDANEMYVPYSVSLVEA